MAWPRSPAPTNVSRQKLEVRAALVSQRKIQHKNADPGSDGPVRLDRISSHEDASIRAEWEGRLIDGRFALLEWLGGSEDRGVFLTVLQGVRKAAIKLIPAEGAEADELIARWEKARTLSHPHLMGVLETGRCVLTAQTWPMW